VALKHQKSNQIIDPCDHYVYYHCSCKGEDGINVLLNITKSPL